MRLTKKLLIIVSLSLVSSLLLTNSTFAAVQIEKIKTTKVASFSCGGVNAQGFTVTPNYYIVGCGHNGPTKVYKKSNPKVVVASKKISGDNGDLDYYSPKDYLVVGGKYFYDSGTLRQVAAAKYSLSFNGSYDTSDDVFVLANNDKVEVRGDVLKEKSPKLYKSFSTVHTNQGSFYHNGVFYRVIYCLRSGTNASTCRGSNIGRGQSAVVAYDVTTGKKVGHYITSNFDQAGELQDGSVFGGIGYVSNGDGGIYRITGPASLMKLLSQSNPMKFNKNKNADNNLPGRVGGGGGNQSGQNAGGGSSNQSGQNNGNSNNQNPSAQSNNSNQSQGDVKLEPEHDPQCATILSSWCNDAEADGENTIITIIKFVISVISIGVTVLGTIGLIYSGYLLMTARDNTAQVEKAKKRILEVVIGLVAWALFALLITLFLPDGSGDMLNGVILENYIYYGII